MRQAKAIEKGGTLDNAPNVRSAAGGAAKISRTAPQRGEGRGIELFGPAVHCGAGIFCGTPALPALERTLTAA